MNAAGNDVKCRIQDRPLSAVLAEVRNRHADYEKAIGDAVGKALGTSGTMLRFVGMAYMAKSTELQCAAHINFNFATGAISVEVTLVNKCPAIVQIVTPNGKAERPLPDKSGCQHE